MFKILRIDVSNLKGRSLYSKTFDTSKAHVVTLDVTELLNKVLEFVTMFELKYTYNTGNHIHHVMEITESVVEDFIYHKLNGNMLTDNKELIKMALISVLYNKLNVKDLRDIVEIINGMEDTLIVDNVLPLEFKCLKHIKRGQLTKWISLLIEDISGKLFTRHQLVVICDKGDNDAG